MNKISLAADSMDQFSPVFENRFPLHGQEAGDCRCSREARRDFVTIWQIRRKGPLNGQIMIQGSKNAALPLMAAALLCSGIVELENVPDIQDVRDMCQLLRLAGCQVTREQTVHTGAAQSETRNESGCLRIDTRNLSFPDLSCEMMGKMRSSILLLAPFLHRFGRARVWEPGGCSIGRRPIDLHLEVLEKMGAVFREESRMEVERGQLSGVELSFRFPSVGATEQAVLAAVLANGTTRLVNVAREPEIVELCQFLRRMGAQIEGEGTGELTIHGAQRLEPVRYRVRGDRIAAATFLAAVAICEGTITMQGAAVADLTSVLEVFRKTGCQILKGEDSLQVSMKGRPRAIPYTVTAPYPGFPTDVQSMLTAVLAIADGQSVVEERIFEGRFRAALQLQKLGAHIIMEKGKLQIEGIPHLYHARVQAPDLRGGAALLLAGLACKDGIVLEGCEHILRGYERLPEQLGLLGAEIQV